MAWKQREERRRRRAQRVVGTSSWEVLSLQTPTGSCQTSLREGTQGQGSFECSLHFEGHLHSCCQLSPTARRSGRPQGSLEAHYATGKRSQVSGVRWEVPGLLPNFPAYKPRSLPCPFSLHVPHTPSFWVWTNSILPWQRGAKQDL